MSSLSPPTSSPAKRPVGVSIAAIWSGLFAGLFPLALVLFYFLGPAQGSQLMSIGQLTFAVALALGVIVSAVLTLRGRRAGQLGLVVLFVVHYGGVAYQNYQLAIAGVEIRGDASILSVRVGRSLVTATIITGYLLLSPKAHAFFSGAPATTQPQ